MTKIDDLVHEASDVSHLVRAIKQTWGLDVPEEYARALVRFVDELQEKMDAKDARILALEAQVKKLGGKP